MVGGEDVLDHGAGAFGTPKLKGFGAAHRPGRENEIRQAEGVVRMEMRQEGDAQFPWFQTCDALSPCRCGGPRYDARASVKQIGMVVHHDSDARSERSGSGSGVSVPSMTS